MSASNIEPVTTGYMSASKPENLGPTTETMASSSEVSKPAKKVESIFQRFIELLQTIGLVIASPFINLFKLIGSLFQSKSGQAVTEVAKKSLSPGKMDLNVKELALQATKLRWTTTDSDLAEKNINDVSLDEFEKSDVNDELGAVKKLLDITDEDPVLQDLRKQLDQNQETIMLGMFSGEIKVSVFQYLKQERTHTYSIFTHQGKINIVNVTSYIEKNKSN